MKFVLWVECAQVEDSVVHSCPWETGNGPPSLCGQLVMQPNSQCYQIDPVPPEAASELQVVFLLSLLDWFLCHHIHIALNSVRE